MQPDSDPIDVALRVLADTGPKTAAGLANHGPMTFDALAILDRADFAPQWAQRYREHGFPPIVRRGRLDAAAARAAFGRADRYEDLADAYRELIAERGWSAALREVLPELVPGLSGAAAHGVIRVSHAVRSIGRRENPERREELARALAYHAASFSRLPGSHEKEGLVPASVATRSLSFLPAASRRPAFSIVARLAALEGFAAFPPLIDAVDASGDPEVFLSDLVATAARFFVAQPRGDGTFALLHGVTGVAALRPLLPYLEPDARRAALHYGWQLFAAIACRFGEVALPDRVDAPSTTFDALADRSLRASDEHAIKLTAACLVEWRIDPRPEYVAAAAAGVEHFGG